MNKRAIFWFRRDLRLEDNIGFYHAVKDSLEVIPVFIFDDGIIRNNEDKRLGFIKNAIFNLYYELIKNNSYLLVLEGNREESIKEILIKYNVDAIYVNKSHSAETSLIDHNVEEFCKAQNIKYVSFEDNLLVSQEKIPPRKVFTPFFKKWKEQINGEFDILNPEKINSPQIDFSKINMIPEITYNHSCHWPQNLYSKKLKNFDFHNYSLTRNHPFLDGTSNLSPYIRFGLVSIRKIYNTALAQNADTFISELAWREFWYHIAHYFPESKTQEFQEKRRNIHWQNNDELFEAWKNGKTGYPIVDAGMIQLKQENWIHNRVRMIVASFLTKDLLIDWRYGEKHFSDYLIDYDENINIGNWQWAASVGADPKPLRIFNPVLQSKKFDPECKYIKKYIPELKDINSNEIHDPLKYKLEYYKPIVNHYETSKIAKELYYNSKYHT